MSADLRAMGANRSTRIIHGIEHATANVLEERGLEIWRGLTVDGMFWLEIVNDDLSTKRLRASSVNCCQWGPGKTRIGPG